MPGPRIVISATFTAEPLREPLEFFLRLLRWEETVEFAPFSQVFQTLLDPAGLFARNTGGVNVVLLRAEDLASAEAVDHFVEAVRSAAAHQDAQLLIRAFSDAEAILREQLAAEPRIHILAGAEQDRIYPVTEIYDLRAQALGAIPYTSEYFAALGAYLARVMHRLRVPACKVIALDCDDTLWSGVCGEDGPRGIVLDAPRLALQRFMAAQQTSGRLLAIASKNNEEDVLETFRQNPEMPLTIEQFAARRINWEGKAKSLQSLAEELKLGLDSFLFIDDDPKETAEVSAELPEVAALALPADPNRIPQFLEHVWALDQPEIVTAEDRKRTASYAQQAERANWERRSRSLEEFIAGLELKVEIASVRQRDVARAAQLTQRTNQMNFTSKRRTEAEIRAFLETGIGCVVMVEDRFGDYGSVGLMLLAPDGTELVIDTFLLSCRALGRGVEHRMLRHIGEVALDRGYPSVRVPLVVTPRNAPAKELLASLTDFSPAALARMVYRPSTTIAGQSQKAPDVAMKTRRIPDYRRIAEERYPSAILAAVRAEKAGRLPTRVASEPPRTELERHLCALWSELLSVPSIGIHDNFFDLGGHSLLAVQLVSRLHRDLQIELPLEAVYTGTLTVAELARSIELFQLGQLNDADYASLLAEVENLSDAEAEALLAREMKQETRP